MREWITGRNPVFEVLSARRRFCFHLLVGEQSADKGRLAEILSLAANQKVAVSRVPRASLDKLGENHQGVALETNGYPYVDLADILGRVRRTQQPAFILALDMVQNPQNLGTLMRSAEAVGVHGILIPLARAAGVTPAVVHASSGASEHLLVTQVNLASALELLKSELQAWVVGMDGGPEAQPYSQVRLDGPIVVVVGNEGEGMRALVRKKCDLLTRLPMHGRVDSLNAAVAGSILLYKVLEARESRVSRG